MEDSARQPLRRALIRIARPLFVALVVVSVIKIFVLEAYRIPSGSMETTLVPGDFVLVNKLAFGLRTPKEIPILGLSLPPVTLAPGKGVRRGDVVVFEFTKKSPGNHYPRGSKLVKRVVGLPGDTVLVAGADIRINSRSLRVAAPPGPSPHGQLPGPYHWFGPVVVPRRGQIVALSGVRLSEWAEIIGGEGHEVSLSPEGRILIDGQSSDTYTVQNDYYFVLGDNLRNSLDSRHWGFVADRDLIGEVLMIYWSRKQGTSSGVLSSISSIRWERIGSFVR